MLVKACQRALADLAITPQTSERVMVACSGGRDSMALLRVATVLLGADRVVAGHVDHGTGSASKRTASELSRFCDTQGIRYVSESLCPPSFDEATLRKLRYGALERMRGETEVSIILMAHTRDDQAETVLLGLLRHAGRAALAGMPALRNAVVRPWLGVPRAEVHAYIDRKGWPIWEDPTNREPYYLRNRVRKELLPLLEARYSRSIAERLARIAEESSFEGSPRTMAKPNEGARIQKSVRHCRPEDRPEFNWIGQGVAIQRCPRLDHPEPSAAVAVFDARGVVLPRVRNFRAGDRIRPLGWSTGRKRVSDILGESRIPRELRDRFPLVVDQDDSILWVPRLQRSYRAPITETTAEVWVFSVAES